MQPRQESLRWGGESGEGKNVALGSLIGKISYSPSPRIVFKLRLAVASPGRSSGVISRPSLAGADTPGKLGSRAATWMPRPPRPPRWKQRLGPRRESRGFASPARRGRGPRCCIGGARWGLAGTPPGMSSGLVFAGDFLKGFRRSPGKTEN